MRGERAGRPGLRGCSLWVLIAGTEPVTERLRVRPTPEPRASGTCSPPTSWARTSCSGTSSRARPGPASWSSAATCAPFTHPLSGSRSSATTSAPP